MVDTDDAAAALFPERVGDRLRAARIAAGLDLADIATKTRVPLRHLQAIEGGDYAALPGVTYCVGFVRAYARAVGLDEPEAANDVRSELRDLQLDHRAERVEYQVADATRLPGKTLAWTAAAVALLLAIGWGVWRNNMVSTPAPDTEMAMPPSDVQTTTPPVDTVAASLPTAPLPAATNAAGEVVLTATNAVWLRIYDASDKVLLEKEMAAGERYVVPADANNPQIRTGRADLIAVTIDGKAVAPLGPAERTVKNVGISAAALTARTPASVPVTGAPTAILPNSSIPVAATPARP